jgi:hypothetical protein
MAPSPRIPGPLLLPPLSSLTLSSLRRRSLYDIVPEAT